MNDILKALLKRCEQCFPDRDVSVISLEKAEAPREQIDRVIEFLNHRKEDM